MKKALFWLFVFLCYNAWMTSNIWTDRAKFHGRWETTWESKIKWAINQEVDKRMNEILIKQTPDPELPERRKWVKPILWMK